MSGVAQATRSAGARVGLPYLPTFQAPRHFRKSLLSALFGLLRPLVHWWKMIQWPSSIYPLLLYPMGWDTLVEKKKNKTRRQTQSKHKISINWYHEKGTRSLHLCCVLSDVSHGNEPMWLNRAGQENRWSNFRNYEGRRGHDSRITEAVAPGNRGCPCRNCHSPWIFHTLPLNAPNISLRMEFLDYLR